MAFICPLMSSATEKVECTTNCALCLKEGGNITCAININALHTSEIEKKIDLITRKIKH